MASLYGPKPLDKGTLTWRITQDGNTLQHQTADVTGIANSHVSTLKKLNINWPKVDKTARLNLSVELKGSGYSLANDWDFWVFPKEPAPDVVAAADKQSASLLSQRWVKNPRLQANPLGFRFR